MGFLQGVPLQCDTIDISFFWTGVISHFLLIKAYKVTKASRLQPFAHSQLVFASTVGVWAFDAFVNSNIVLGCRRHFRGRNL